MPGRLSSSDAVALSISTGFRMPGAVAGMAGCGERPQVIEYKQGNYQGKPDNPPWESAAFKGDKAAWERAIKARNQNQNEYRRTA